MLQSSIIKTKGKYLKYLLILLFSTVNLYATVDTYAGNISKYEITMSIMSDDENITGNYFYHSQLTDIKVKGKILNNVILIDEYNDKDEMVARFFGNFDKTISSMTGTWTNYSSKETFPFYLRLEHSTRGTLERLYATDYNPEMKIQKIHQAIKNNQKFDLIQFISFPTKIYISGELTTFKTKKDFLKKYDEIFDEKYRTRISKAIPKNMFHNSQGIMLGSGEIWFTLDGDIKSLNK